MNGWKRKRKKSPSIREMKKRHAEAKATEASIKGSPAYAEYRSILTKMVRDADSDDLEALKAAMELANGHLSTRMEEEAKGSAQERLKARFDAAESHVELGLWRAVALFKMEQFGPCKAVEITGPRATVSRSFIVHDTTTRWPGYAEVKIDTRKDYDGWGIWKPGERYHNYLSQYGFQLPDRIAELRKVIQENHPDRGGDPEVARKAIAEMKKLKRAA